MKGYCDTFPGQELGSGPSQMPRAWSGAAVLKHISKPWVLRHMSRAGGEVGVQRQMSEAGGRGRGPKTHV